RLRELALDPLEHDAHVAKRPQPPLLLEEQGAERIRQPADREAVMDVRELAHEVALERRVARALDLQLANAALRLRPLIDQRAKLRDLLAETLLDVRLALDQPLQLAGQLAERRRRALTELGLQRRELLGGPREIELVDAHLDPQQVDTNGQGARVETRGDQRRVTPPLERRAHRFARLRSEERR